MNTNTEKTFLEELMQNRLFFEDLAKKDINALFDFYERHDIATLDCKEEERELYVERLWEIVEADLKKQHGIVDMETVVNEIREYHQISIATVNKDWCIQLFDLDVSANDQEDCVYETHGEKLITVLTDALDWANENNQSY